MFINKCELLFYFYSSDNTTEFEIAGKVYMVNMDPPLETPFFHPFQYNIQIRQVTHIHFPFFCLEKLHRKV